MVLSNDRQCESPDPEAVKATEEGAVARIPCLQASWKHPMDLY